MGLGRHDLLQRVNRFERVRQDAPWDAPLGAPLPAVDRSLVKLALRDLQNKNSSFKEKEEKKNRWIYLSDAVGPPLVDAPPDDP